MADRESLSISRRWNPASTVMQSLNSKACHSARAKSKFPTSVVAVAALLLMNSSWLSDEELSEDGEGRACSQS